MLHGTHLLASISRRDRARVCARAAAQQAGRGTTDKNTRFTHRERHVSGRPRKVISAYIGVFSIGMGRSTPMIRAVTKDAGPYK